MGFRYTAMTSRTTAAVSAVHMDEGTPRDHSGQPSIVLRMVGNGERLWDIAKSYGTTAQDIMCANALEEDVAPEAAPAHPTQAVKPARPANAGRALVLSGDEA